MTNQDVVNVLSEIPVGTVIAWASVIFAIIGILIAGGVKLFKLFSQIKEYQNDREDNIELLHKHDEVLDEMSETLKRIEHRIETEADIHKRELKHSITSKCNTALKGGEILLSELRSIEESFEDYENVYHGNSWVHTLVEKVRLLPVVSDIDDE